MTFGALYICYQSLLDPLTQTQVIAYLEGLAVAGHRIVLLTFEPRDLTESESMFWKAQMEPKGIVWQWHRYHKWPTAPATAWDVFVGILSGFLLIRKYQIRLVHARAHVPGLMALALKRLTGVKFLFDIRGFMAEEYVDAGIWPSNGKLFRLTKRFEARMVLAADGFVVLTSKARDLLEHWYPEAIRHKPLGVIPCCVDLRRVPPLPENANGMPSERKRVIAYIGKLGGWYLTKEMAEFVSQAIKLMPELRWQIWTQSDSRLAHLAASEAGLADDPEIGQLSPTSLALELTKVQAGLSFVKPCLSKLASSATKVAEYLAAGLPVVATAGIGDTDEHLTGAGDEVRSVGVLVRQFTCDAYLQAAIQLRELLHDPLTPARCRAAAKLYYDLESIGWKRYVELYRLIMV